MLFLVNPGDKMAARKRKRLKNGRFAKTTRKRRAPARRTRARKNPPRRKRRTSPRKRRTTVAARKRAPARRRRRAPARRRNPDVVKMLTRGVADAGYLLAGEAATRAVPTLLRLPTGGAAGPLLQAATGVAVGFAADRMLGASQGAMVLAGALAVPIRDAVVRMGVPVLSPALTPTPLAGGSYVGRRSFAGGEYVRRAGLAGGEYVPPGVPAGLRFRNGAGASPA